MKIGTKRALSSLISDRWWGNEQLRQGRQQAHPHGALVGSFEFLRRNPASGAALAEPVAVAVRLKGADRNWRGGMKIRLGGPNPESCCT